MDRIVREGRFEDDLIAFFVCLHDVVSREPRGFGAPLRINKLAFPGTAIVDEVVLVHFCRAQLVSTPVFQCRDGKRSG